MIMLIPRLVLGAYLDQTKFSELPYLLRGHMYPAQQQQT